MFNTLCYPLNGATFFAMSLVALRLPRARPSRFDACTLGNEGSTLDSRLFSTYFVGSPCSVWDDQHGFGKLTSIAEGRYTSEHE